MAYHYQELSRSIIIAAKKGSRDDFNRIVERYQRPIYGFVNKMTHSPTETEDLTQEIFLKLYLNIKKYDPERRFSSWLFTIARRIVIDYFRKKGRNKELFIIDDPENYFEPSIDPPNMGDKIDIQEAFLNLKPRYQRVLFLRYWKGESYRSISRKSHLSLNTVKTYIRRGKKELRRKLPD
ncbi:hypothetical protein COV82_00750 [Candidatus Peregrinibacteria bacterium CG11_big_fil_rev_8_21_14_0_20_46_8]|nr:MAG: hypothetical protein COV82_00750 [Candidatus Peregrinibacteria bacterium CG11_big_fil_rev_8_21_14_0_20_46_8]